MTHLFIRKLSAGLIAAGVMLVYLFASVSFSQNTPLNTNVVVFPDSSCKGDTETVVVYIKNTGPVTYAGNINIYYSTDSATLIPTVLLCTDSNAVINSNDSILHTCLIVVDSSYFQTSGNYIIVVWASGGAIAPPGNYKYESLYVCSVTGIQDYYAENSMALYPTLANDYVIAEFKDALLPEKISISDAAGKIVSALAVPSAAKKSIRINTSSLAPGIYFLDVCLPDNSRMVSKFIKAE